MRADVEIKYTESYRSGHNEPDSKSGVPHGTVGSNPTLSAKKASPQAVLPLGDISFPAAELMNIGGKFSPKEGKFSPKQRFLSD